MYCPKCGNDNPENAQVCQSCGQPISAPPQTPDTKPKTSKLAIWSFVLGILSPLTCMVTALPAIICGICGLVRVSKNKGQLKGTGLAVTGLAIPVGSIVFIPILAMILAILMPALGKTRQLAQQMVCSTNLSGLGKAMMVYTNDYNDTYPTAENWCDLLIEKCDVAVEQFCCPSSGAEKGESSYVLNINLAGKKASQIPPDMVLLFETHIRKTPSCKRRGSCYEVVLPDKTFWNRFGGRELLSTENHQDGGCNVLYVDGHVKFEKDPNSLRWTVE